jgi:hypothetical protein
MTPTETDTKATSTATEDLNVVFKTISVAAPVGIAFRVFTEGMSTWWPIATHHIGKTEAQAVVIEPRAGGRCFERGVDGSECTWGHVQVWDPPARFVFSWEIGADWQANPSIDTRVEVRFIAEGPGHTRVELTHSNLGVYGARRDEMRNAFDSPGGWTGLLELYSRVAASAA